jgi:hypothetical protein
MTPARDTGRNLLAPWPQRHAGRKFRDEEIPSAKELT